MHRALLQPKTQACCLPPIITYTIPNKTIEKLIKLPEYQYMNIPQNIVPIKIRIRLVNFIVTPRLHIQYMWSFHQMN